MEVDREFESIVWALGKWAQDRGAHGLGPGTVGCLGLLGLGPWARAWDLVGPGLWAWAWDLKSHQKPCVFGPRPEKVIKNLVFLSLGPKKLSTTLCF